MGSRGRYDRASFQWLAGGVFFTGRGNKGRESVPTVAMTSRRRRTFSNSRYILSMQLG